ncbi:MAG: glycosyltransferase family 39 protein [Gemmatimonadota bacterium]|nr:glycosyltransferase family 39 protein [Gemmatimonadota bacterium]
MRTEGLPVSRAEWVLVAALLAAFAAASLLSMARKSPTFDETAHLGAGVSYVRAGDFRMNPEHPALPKLAAGAAALAAGARMPESSDAWRDGDQWAFGREVLYESPASWKRILFAARLPTVLAGLLLGFVVWVWTRAMAGAASAAVALGLFAFEPNIVAHSRLVTTDIPLALWVTAACACLWTARRTGRTRWVVAAGACFAASMATKFSAFSYAPVYAALALIPSPSRDLRRGFAHLGVLAGTGALLTLLVVWASYGLATDFASIRSIGMTGRGVHPEGMSLIRRIPYEVLATIPWPSVEFARGMKDVLLYTEGGHPVFLCGMRADHGWWWFAPVAFFAKTPLPVLALVLWGVSRIRGRHRMDTLFLLLPVALVFATNMLARLGIGFRHVLPAMPFLLILAALPFRRGLPSSRVGVVIAGGLLLWHLGGSARVHPDYLSYFHEAAGGVSGGARILGDSSLDWGQDLSRATDALHRHGVDHAILCYFGTANPFAEEMRWQLLPPTWEEGMDGWERLPESGPVWLAMSVTNLQGVYIRARRDEPPFPWLVEVEPEERVGGIWLYDLTNRPRALSGMAETYRRNGMRREAEAALHRAGDGP